MKTRILQITNGLGETEHWPQVKGWFFWRYIRRSREVYMHDAHGNARFNWVMRGCSSLLKPSLAQDLTLEEAKEIVQEYRACIEQRARTSAEIKARELRRAQITKKIIDV